VPIVIAVVGVAILAGSLAGARHRFIHPVEQRVFHAINGLPGALFPVLWLPMQLGNLVVGTVAGLVVALVAGELSVAVGVVLAMGLKLVVERLLRRELRGHVPARTRPGSSQHDAVLRGDVPDSGASFPSGHIVLVAAIACVVAPVIPTGWELVPYLLTLLVMVGRVYVGAHNPLDVTAGLGAGVVLGGLVASLIRS
jgi:membrane-associated phospholipid phosphatase